MPSASREQELLDRMWERVRPLIPKHPAHPNGGRPFVPDEACFAGIVYQLRNAIRWNDMPAGFPSGVTCWRRHRDWTKARVWTTVRRIILRELEAAGRLNTSELFLDATFAEARKGGDATAPRNAA